MSIKNSNDIIGNRTRDLPACIAVPQPTAPPLTPACELDLFKFIVFHRKTNILYLSPQALFKTKITASNDGDCKDFIYCSRDRHLKLIFIIFGDQKEHHQFSGFKKY
jgi:hypothetical protein